MNFGTERDRDNGGGNEGRGGEETAPNRKRTGCTRRHAKRQREMEENNPPLFLDPLVKSVQTYAAGKLQ